MDERSVITHCCSITEYLWEIIQCFRVAVGFLEVPYNIVTTLRKLRFYVVKKMIKPRVI